jgi:hypothetical protein
VPPAQGGPDDPRTVDAIVAVYNSVAPDGELVPVGLPAAGWRARGPNAYKYADAATTGITSVILKPDQLAFKGGKAGWSYTLNEPSQGRVAVILLVGRTVYCSDAPAKASGRPPSTASNSS